MRRLLLTVLSLASLILLATPASAQQADRPLKRSRNVLTSEEIQKVAPSAQTAYDAVVKLRPDMLRDRRGGEPVTVTVDGVTKTGGVEVLESIGADEVVTIQYIAIPTLLAAPGPELAVTTNRRYTGR